MLKKITSIILCIAMLVSNLCLNVQTAFAESKALAFPGAEGGGMFALGARASDNVSIYHVTNLNDSGSGSFRDAVSKGDRIIVFDVAGTVMLESDLKSSASNITILGQTAPGEGICIGGASVQFSGGSNIIIRYMRFRSGDYSGSQEDGLGIRRCTDVILDHCSISWSVDECLSAYENKNFTAQYCIISESLNQSIHGKGAHGYGGIWGGINASFHHNLISSHNSRNPRIGTSATVHSYNDTPDYESLIDIRNNVIYNWGSNSSYGGENNVRVNIVNNYYKPSSASKVQRIYEHYFGNNNEGTTLHLSGNVMEGNDAVTNDNWLGVSVYNDNNITWTKCENISDGYTDSDGNLWANDQYIYDYPVTTQSAEEAYNSVLENAGASFVRDDIDKRVIDDVRNNTVPTGNKSGSGLIDSQADVGGWTALYGSKEADTDNDGMPDTWEDSNGLDKNNANDSIALSSNGYTNIEEYTNYLASQSVYEMDKTSLKTAIKTAQELDRAHYGDDVDFLELDNAVAQGIGLLSSRAATQEQINDCADLIYTNLNSFTEDEGWRLIEAITRAEEINKWDYTADSYSILEAAIANGDEILNSDYTKESIDAAVDLINKAEAGLEKSVRRSLQSLLRKCNGVVNTGYYSDCWNSFKSEIAASEKLYNDFYVSEEDYHNSIESLNNAYDNLRGNFTEKVKLNETFETGDTGIIKSNSRCNAVYTNDIYGNEGGCCIINKMYPDDYDASIYVSLTSSENTVCTGSSVIVSEDVCFNSKDVNATVLSFAVCDFNAKNVTPVYLRIGVNSGMFYAAAIDDFKSNIKIEPYKWYNISMYLNNLNKTISFYVDGHPIAENVELKSNWGSDFYNSLLYNTRSSHEYIYIDNLSIIERTYNNENHLYGDSDYSGKLTSADAAYVLQKVLDNSFSMPIENNISNYMDIVDVDCDGSLTANDTAIILQKILNTNFVMPIETSTTTTETTTEATSEVTSETTRESTESTTIIVDSVIDFEDAKDSLESPYIKDYITIENPSGKIDIADIDIFNYKKAIKLDGNTITIDAPVNLNLEISAKTTGSSDVWLNTSDGMIIIPGGEDVSANVEVSKGTYTISGSNVYIAALRLYNVIDLDTTSTESTTEATTETTTDTTTETTTNSAIEFDFSELENGTYTTDFTNGIFSLIAGEGSYTIGGDDEKYITLNSLEYSANASEGYILIDAEAMVKGFMLNIEGILQGYSYGRLALINAIGDTVDMYEFYNSSDKTKAVLNADTNGKYILRIVSGMPISIYKLNITEKD